MQNRSLLYLFMVAFVFIATNSFGQKIEAENAILTGGAVKANLATASGGYIVEQRGGNLELSADITRDGFYDVYIYAASPGGDKTNFFEINGTSISFSMVENSSYSRIKLVGTLKLTIGTKSIAIKNSWGWINIDYIEFVEVDPSERFNISQSLVNPNATDEAVALYNFLLDNYGKKIISGVMTLESFDETNWLKQNTGKEPALVGLDLMHVNRGYTWYNEQTVINDATTWYNRNGIPIVTWHWRDPSRSTESFYSAETSFDVSKIFDVNSAEYKAMLSDIDYTAGLLKGLQNNNVPILWRPIHEAKGAWFWWGAKGAEPCKKLWEIMYDRMVNFHGLNNLIWVWTREPGDDLWYPGDDLVDIVGRDVYKDGDHTSQVLEFNTMNELYSGKKMVTLSETGSYPDVDNLINDAAGWSWYMPWYGKYTRDSFYNTLDLWKKMFASDYVITLDEMPNLRTYKRIVTGTDFAQEKVDLFVYPTITNDQITVNSANEIFSVVVYNLSGFEMKRLNTFATEVSMSLSDLTSGMYFLKINGEQTVRIVKK